VVPLEQLHRRGERAEQRVGSAGLGDLDLVPADLRLGDAVRLSAGRLGQQLAPKADTQDGSAALKRVADELLLRIQPSVLVILIDMHRAPEDHESVGAAGGRRARRGHPRRKLPEHPRPGVQLVNDRKDSHSGVT
jgi:hypothetical protein